MTTSTQLLCTFCQKESLDEVIKSVSSTYSIAFDCIYVLENSGRPDQLCCTYNIYSENVSPFNLPENTISLHRKKLTNTLYTINALNILVTELNGVVDPKFQIPWEDYRNTILVTAYGKLKIINTKLLKIVRLKDNETTKDSPTSN